jgi:hypothetical protein
VAVAFTLEVPLRWETRTFDKPIVPAGQALSYVQDLNKPADLDTPGLGRAAKFRLRSREN